MFLKFNIQDYLLPCLNKKFLGIDCPGCGIQRSIVHLVKGEFAEAFQLYPAIFTLVFLFTFILINKKLKLKHASKIIFTLAIINVLIISISYIIKMNFIFNL
ncbi:DUF2752 domain-containing protein [Tenacibaculum aquimarinum]|uniref:DUF2752 domain-containing protein n=1 Tax=Tenacibaculum aquimarinum TaxID=2910675 RepID=UPI00215E388B|nr:DUF2752 domain-containing protein [Tenacibaculum aquimarinum]